MTTQHRIALSNQKGGVGKTTCTRELGIYLASTGRSVLVVDCDPQANLSRSLLDGPQPGMYEALSGGAYTFGEACQGMAVLCGEVKLALLEKALIGELDAHTRVKELLTEGAFAHFEYILFDTPPSLGVLTVNALVAAKHVLVPMNPSLYSMQGTNDLMATISKVRKNLNNSLDLIGVIINAYDSHPLITRQIHDEICHSFGDLVFSTELSKSVKVEEAIAGKSGLIAMKSKLREEIALIGGELVRRVEGV